MWRRFCKSLIARGSLTETRYFVHLSGRLGYLTQEQAEALQEQADGCLRVLAGLIRSVEKGLFRRICG